MAAHTPSFEFGRKHRHSILGLVFLLCAVFFSLQIIPRWWGDSIITDEEWELTASYYYWKKGDVWTPCGTPGPGAFCALPLLFMDLKLDPNWPSDYLNRSLNFLFLANLDHLEAVTVWSRAVQLVLGLLLGFLIYRQVRDGPLPLALSALVLWAFEPNLLAFTGTAKTDIAMAFWFFLGLSYFQTVQTQGGKKGYILTGFLAGLAATARYNGLMVLPIMLILEVSGWRDRSGNFRSKLAALSSKGIFILAGFLAAVFLVYLPGTLLHPGHWWPFTYYLHYLSGYSELWPQVHNSTFFFAGRFWENGSYLFFPFHFLFKNTFPFLLLVFFALAAALQKKISIPRWLWIPPLVHLLFFYSMDKGMMVRHVLPIYPFLILLAARAFQWTWESCRASKQFWVRAFPVLLLAWHPLSALSQFPHHLAYANELLAGSRKADWLQSSNWDLGQDTKRLVEKAREKGWKKVKLLTYQRTDPYFYGLVWESWTHRDLAQPQPGTVYVVDPSILNNIIYAAYLANRCPWLGSRPQTGTIGGTMLYYEIPGDPGLVPKDNSEPVNSFPYYLQGNPPYRISKTN